MNMDKFEQYLRGDESLREHDCFIQLCSEAILSPVRYGYKKEAAGIQGLAHRELQAKNCKPAASCIELLSGKYWER